MIEGGKPGETVALRADLDPLPIKEENEHDFVSKNEGVMHACGHASKPHQTTDAIVVAAQVINGLQSIISRIVNPIDPAVLTIGKIEGGTRYNAVAEKVTMESTIRTFKPETKERVKSSFYSIVDGVAGAMGAESHIEYRDGYPATINTPEGAELVRETSQEILGADATPELEPSLGGEDIGRFLLEYPGAYFRLGTANPQDEEQRQLHDPRFDIDEAALQIGAELIAQIAVDALYHLREE